MKNLIILPTYNEAENIENLIIAIYKYINADSVDILVVDDDSPDGTGTIVENLRAKFKTVYMIRRKDERGRGSAGIVGFKYGLSNGYDRILEMDADFSHNPIYLPDILKMSAEYDVVIGSRFVSDGEDINRGSTRKFISLVANFYLQRMFKLDVSDATSGYRCFRTDVIRSIDLDTLISTGPSIVIEILIRTRKNGFSIKEVPIAFANRHGGKSKFSFRVMMETFLMTLKFKKDLNEKFIFKPAK